MSVKSAMTALADAIRSKTGSAERMTLAEMPELITGIQSGGDEALGALLDGSITEITIPPNVVTLRPYAFNKTKIRRLTLPPNVSKTGEYLANSCIQLEEVTIENSEIFIGTAAFCACSALKTVKFPNGIKSLGTSMFISSGLEAFIIPDNTTRVKTFAFSDCKWLHTVYIPASVTYFESAVFARCVSLENVTLGNGFNASGLNLDLCPLTVESMVQILGALADNTGATAKALTLGTTNLEKLTDEQIAIATNKNWTLA